MIYLNMIISISFIGFVYASAKVYVLTSALTKNRAKELNIVSPWITLIKNPFWIFLYFLIGFFECVRIVLSMLASIVDIMGEIWNSIFKEHRSATNVYNYTMIYAKDLTKEDLALLAVKFDVPIIHLMEIWREPNAKVVKRSIKERLQHSAISGSQLNIILLAVQKWNTTQEKTDIEKTDDK